MTLVVCAYLENNLTCLADTRISQNGITISDTGVKLFIVPVTTKFLLNDDVKNEFKYTLGFAFCGSTLMASNTHAIASNCTQIMYSSNLESIPCIASVSNIYAKSAEFVMRDTNARVNDKTFFFFEGLVFGFCPVQEKFRIFQIKHDLSDSIFKVESRELDVKPGSIFPIGSGKDEFLKLIQIPNSAGNPRTVLDVFTQIMTEDNVKDVGGAPQILQASKTGLSFKPILTQDPDNLDHPIVTINGFNTNNIGLPNEFGFGIDVWGIGVEKIEGRKALRNIGIDPDSQPISKKLQNLASIIYTVKIAHQDNKNKIGFSDNYSIEKISPIKNEWYFYSRCKNCKEKTPLFSDPTLGKSNITFTGNGKINSNCVYCDSIISCNATSLKSFQWYDKKNISKGLRGISIKGDGVNLPHLDTHS